jgi:hypothetical protein
VLQALLRHFVSMPSLSRPACMIQNKQAHSSWRSTQPIHQTSFQQLRLRYHYTCNHAVREKKNFGSDMEAARDYLHSQPQGAGPIAGLLNFLSNTAFGAGRVRATAAGAACWAFAALSCRGSKCACCDSKACCSTSVQHTSHPCA